METIKKLLVDGVINIDDLLEYARWYEQKADEYYSNYGDWECSEGTLHAHNEECDCPDSSMYFPMHSENPEYIIASTLRHEEETLLFECDENGVITSRDDYSGIAERWVPGIDWTDSDLAVTTVFGKDVFERISDVMPHERGYYVRYKRKQIN